MILLQMMIIFHVLLTLKTDAQLVDPTKCTASADMAPGKSLHYFIYVGLCGCILLIDDLTYQLLKHLLYFKVLGDLGL